MSLSASAIGVFSGTGRLTFVVTVGMVVLVEVEIVAATVVVVLVVVVVASVMAVEVVLLVTDFCFSAFSALR